MEQTETSFPTVEVSEYVNKPKKHLVIINDLASSDDTGIECSDIDVINADESSICTDSTDLPSDVSDSVGLNTCEIFPINPFKISTDLASTLVHNPIVCDKINLSYNDKFKEKSWVPLSSVEENKDNPQAKTTYVEIKGLTRNERKEMNIEKRSVKHSAVSLQRSSNFCENKVDTPSKTNIRVTDTSTKCGRVDCPNTKNWKSGPPPFFNLPEATFPPRPTKPAQSGIVVPVDKEDKVYSVHQAELKTKIANSNEKTHRKKKKNIQGMSGDLTLDINGNFSQPRQQSGLSRGLVAMQSSVSRNGDNYERQSSKNDTSHRKIKHTRNTNDSHSYMLPEGITGLQSLNNLEEHPSDKKYKVNKTVGIGGSGTRKVYYSQNLSIGNKAIPGEEIVKKERLKDTKTNFNSNKNWRNPSKQRCFPPVHDSSEEEISTMNFKRNPQSDGGDNENISSTACATNPENYLDWSACVPDPPEEKNPDSSLSSEILSSSVISSSNCTNSSFMVDGEVSSFVRDFYAVTDPEQQLEESEFKVVVKKQRKQQPKRLDSCRRYSAASGSTGSDHEFSTQGRSHTDKIMLLASLPISHHTQLRKLDSFHCKSTSSMPPSEHSSADNSDLDSVHSLPVGSSASNASCSASLPATSSASATLQASYADIARSTMPSASKSHTCNILRQPQTVHVKINEQNSANYSEIGSVIVHNTVTSKQMPSDYSSDNLHEIKRCTESNEGIIFHPSDSNKEPFYAHSSVDSLKKPSFLAGLPFTSKNSDDKEIVSNKHRSNLQSDVADNSDVICSAFSQKSQHRVPNSSNPVETCVTSIQSQWLFATSKSADDCGNSSSEVNKSALVKHNAVAKQKQPAVIIMDNCLPTGNVSGVSFGIDFNELLQLNSGNDAIQISPLPLPSDASLSIKSAKIESLEQSLDKRTESENHMKNILHSGHPQSSSLQKACEDKGHIPSPHVIAGLGIRWKDLAVDTRTFNYEQIVNFLYKAWDDAIQENKGTSGREGIRMKYYSDTNA